MSGRTVPASMQPHAAYVAWRPRYVTEAIEFVSNSLVDYLRHASRYFCALILAVPASMAQVSQFEGLPIQCQCRTHQCSSYTQSAMVGRSDA